MKIKCQKCGKEFEIEETDKPKVCSKDAKLSDVWCPKCRKNLYK